MLHYAKKSFIIMLEFNDMTKRNIATLIAIITMSASLAMATGPSVSAATCSGADTMIIECGSEAGGPAIINIIGQIINILMAGVGILAVGAVIYGAILYAMSGDKPDNMKKAKTVWVNTVIGLALFAFIVSITNFLIPGGIF